MALQGTPQNQLPGGLPPAPAGTTFGDTKPPEYKIEQPRKGIPLNFILLLLVLIPVVLIGYFYVTTPNAQIFQDVKRMLGVYQPQSYPDDGLYNPPPYVTLAVTDPAEQNNFEKFIYKLTEGGYEVAGEGQYDMEPVGGQKQLYGSNVYYFQNARLVAIEAPSLDLYAIVEDDDQKYTLVDRNKETARAGLTMDELKTEGIVLQDPLIATFRLYLSGNVEFRDNSDSESQALVNFNIDLGFPGSELQAVYKYSPDSTLQSIELIDPSTQDSLGTVTYSISQSQKATELTTVPENYQTQ
ncbi:MAG: hypothetical protein TR69_WS6001001383 [candidate division WS6 bacterium OLB20]|uniref:Uncharacterized protein n=1 Tax=candidate division WS6 bacterium OLB20 TaxID=1617426 RepID=A0A136LWR7_9BACT|nr:MAG: hypothetical protein TR69_WS6001001383 [candidate division WS6 bacterium OLB20]